MERVSTYMMQRSMLADFSRTQRTLLDAQEQVSTGRKINEFSDSPSSLPGLIAARAAVAKSEDYLASAKSVQQRTDLQDFHIGELSSTATDLRQTIFDAIGNGDGSDLRSAMEAALQRISSLLNSQLDGKYIYGGTRQDVQPVTANTLDALAAVPTVQDAFQNSDVAQSAQVDAYQTISYGKLASELGGPFMDVIRQFVDYDASASGPIGKDLTEDQKTFLTSLLAPLDATATGLNAQQATNGIAQKAAEDAIDRHGAMQDRLKVMISDITDVDMAEAVTKLNSAQIALQASAQTFAAVQGMTLLDFLS